jgi:hypothetical protein
VHRSKHTPLYFGATGDSRFDSPDGSFGALYAARQVNGAFVEVFCRDAVRELVETQLSDYHVAEIRSSRGLKLIDLGGKGLVRMGLDARLATGDYRIAQRWAAAFYDHRDKADGILYRSRHDPEQQLAAIFDRTKTILSVQRCGTLRAYLGEDAFFALLDNYGVAML